MPILTEKQLDGLFLQALVRMKTEPALYHEETQKILTGIIKERQRMESELNVGLEANAMKTIKGWSSYIFRLLPGDTEEIKMDRIDLSDRGLPSGIGWFHSSRFN